MTADQFSTQQSGISTLFLEVKFDFGHLARTWVVKEEEGSDKPRKKLIKDSLPGVGVVRFFEVGATSEYKNVNRLVISTYLDLQKISDVGKFLEGFEIFYQLLEDNDIPGDFFENQIFRSRPDEYILSDDKKRINFTKVIEIR